MWLTFHREQEYRFVELRDCFTVGTARSNPIPLQGRDILPLHGQFQNAEGSWIYHDFSLNKKVPLEAASVLHLDAWAGTAYSAEQFLELNSSLILEAFQKILKQFTPLTFGDGLEIFRQSNFFGHSPPNNIVDLVRAQFHEYRLRGPVETLLERGGLTDILIEGFDRIWIEESGEMKRSEVHFTSKENYQIYIENLLAYHRRSLDEAQPYLDLMLPKGVRCHMIGPPLTPGQIYLSLRKPRETDFSLDELRDRKFLSHSQWSIILQALHDRSNILISGATGSGKTTLLKALISEIRCDERIVVIEDTPELVSERSNTSYLKTRPILKSGLPEVSMRTLLRQSLRMRPDRIVVGEVRGAEALDLMQAMNTGHRGSMGSLHANSPRDALLRLQGLMRESEQSLSEEVSRDLIAQNLNIILHCDRRGGKRCIGSIGLIRGLDGSRVLMETIE